MTIRRWRVSPESLAAMRLLGPAVINERLRMHAWKAINDERGEREAFGLVDPRQLLSGELSYEMMRMGAWLLMAVRRDRKSINARVRRAHVEIATAERMHALGVTRLDRRTRLAVAEEVERRLAQDAGESVSITSVGLQMNTGELWIGTGSRGACERIVDLLSAALRLQAWPDDAAMWANDADPLESNELAAAGYLEIAAHYGGRGREFLDWLGRFSGQDLPAGVRVDVTGPLVYESLHGEATRVTAVGEDALEAPEAVAARAEGKRLARARVRLTTSAGQFEATVDAESLVLSGARLPVPRLHDQDEALTMRLDAMENVVGALRGLFGVFAGRDVPAVSEEPREADVVDADGEADGGTGLEQAAAIESAEGREAWVREAADEVERAYRRAAAAEFADEERPNPYVKPACRDAWDRAVRDVRSWRLVGAWIQAEAVSP